MGDEYLDNCLSNEANDDTYKEKTRIAEVAAATLCRLNSIMRQMKDWRDDRVKLRSNIWRLKLALRVAGRETNDTLHADPLIEHQRAEIKRLEGSNQGLKKELSDIKTALLGEGRGTQGIAWKSDEKLEEVKRGYLMERERLNNEIRYLKSRLNEAEEGHEHSSEVEHLKCKLKHFMMVDHTMEIIFTDIVNKVAETIANLSEELVNMNERFHRSQLRNDSLYVEIDKLKAMLRYKSGNITDYQKRVTELNNLTKRLKTELNKFKDSYDGNSWNMNSNYHHDVRIVERLASDLKNKLQNDHEALLAAGDPDCLKYIQKIVDLRVILRQLHVELRKFGNGPRPQSPERMVEYKTYSKQLSILDSTLKEINIEIGQFENDHVRLHCRIGGADGLEYLNKIEEIKLIAEKTRTTMNGLNRQAGGCTNEWEDIEKLEDFVGRMCDEIKQLETIVAASDSSIMVKRFQQLEEFVVRLKTESNEKNNRVDVLEKELLDTESLLEQRMKDLNETHKRVTALVEENKALQWKAKEMEERTWELQREREDAYKELEQLQQVQREISATTKKLQNLQADKEGLLKEIGKIRDVLQKRNEEIKGILADKEATEKVLNAKIMDLTRNLQAAFKENEKLQSKMIEFERTRCKELRIKERSKSAEIEIERLRANLATSIESLENANRDIADLKVKLEHSSAEKARLEASLFQLESKKEDLLYQLGAEKTTSDGRMKELAELQSNYTQVDVERANLKKEKEQLYVELMNLRFDKDMLQKSVDHVRGKCSGLEDEIDKYKSECENLRKENNSLRVSEENLHSQLREARLELNGAGDKISRLEVENSRLHEDVNGLMLKNAGFEGHLQGLVSEKNELATRIIILDKEIVGLKDQLKIVKTINECSTLELNRLRTEHDKTISEKTDLQIALDLAKKSNEELKETNEGLKLKMDEIHSEFKLLENQLKILETNEKYKGPVLAAYTNVPTCGRSVLREQNEHPMSTNEVEQSKLSNEKPGQHTDDATKEKIKKLMTENESLRLEVQNLKSRNLEIEKELTRTKDELQMQKVKLAEGEKNDTSVKRFSSKPEIVHLYYKETNSYSSRCSDYTDEATRIDRSKPCPRDNSTTRQESRTEVERLFEIVNRLKVENIALKIELNSLRCNVGCNLTKDEQWKNKLRDATDEIQALQLELVKLRDEKESLRSQLDTGRTKLDRLESEKVALKNELYLLRRTNSDLKHKVNESRCDYQKLKERNVGFEDCIMKTMKKIKKCTMSTESQDTSNDELKVILKKYISNEEILHAVEHRMNIDRT